MERVFLLIGQALVVVVEALAGPDDDVVVHQAAPQGELTGGDHDVELMGHSDEGNGGCGVAIEPSDLQHIAGAE